MHVLIAGAGFSGAVIARVLAEAGHDVDVADARDHVAGNCHTSRDVDTGVMVHRYGPHLFHTRHQHVVEFLSRFSELVPNQHRVRATTASGIYSMPLNLLSMNQFFGTRHGPGAMRALVDAQRDRSITDPQDFEEQALSMMGRRLYDEFFAGYTTKQWGRHPSELPASILKRLPMRFSYDDRYFQDPHEYLPQHGYTEIVERILDHPRIAVTLSTAVRPSDHGHADHLVWTGPLDGFFDHAFGKLAYRTLDFEWQQHTGSFQGCSVMNFCDPSVPYTRVAEHNYFEPWAENSQSIIGIETSRECADGDIPYYPVRLARDHSLLDEYMDLARRTEHVTFAGRLGTYRYIDMDGTIDEALTTAAVMLRCIDRSEPLPAFALAEGPAAGT